MKPVGMVGRAALLVITSPQSGVIDRADTMAR